MGEYGKYNGNEIKIGTCEDMYYLRADQIHLVKSTTLMHLDEIRFRFPFPDEDNIEPGDFDDHDRGLVVWGFEVPEGVEHYSVQFKADVGILASLPCPYSAEAKEGKIKYHFNGYRGPARIVQQRAWEGVWVTVVDCGACGARFRLPTLADALPLLEALERQAKSAKIDGRNELAMTYAKVGNRVAEGYRTAVPGKPPLGAWSDSDDLMAAMHSAVERAREVAQSSEEAGA